LVPAGRLKNIDDFRALQGILKSCKRIAEPTIS